MKPLAVMVVQAAVVLGWHGRGTLLADSPIPWDQVAAGGVSGTAVVVGWAAVQAWIAYRKRKTEDVTETTDSRMKEDKQRAEIERKVRKDLVDEYRTAFADFRETRDEMIEELRKTRELDREEIHNLRNALNAETLAHAVTRARLDVYEHPKGPDQGASH